VGRRRGALVGVGLGLAGLWVLAAAPPVAAAPASTTVRVGAHVGPRTVVQPERDLVTLDPGARQTVLVTVKARFATGSTRLLTLDSPSLGIEPVPVVVAVAGTTRGLVGVTPLATLPRSGVYQVPVTLHLARTARGPVTLPLRFRLVSADRPVLVADASDARP